MNKPLLILASASPRRSELMRRLGVEFRIVPSSATEINPEHLSPGEIAQINACRKAAVVSKKYPDAVVIGMDTLVALGQRVFGKPADLTEAHQMLLQLQGKTHTVYTGVCLTLHRNGRQKVFAEQTEVTFRSLTAEQIKHYHAQVNPLDKAGAYGIQEQGDLIVHSVSGSFANVVGLPLERLRAELDSFMVSA